MGLVQKFLFLILLAMISLTTGGVMAQSFAQGDRQPDSDIPSNANSPKRNYPGGRDDSELTVQPMKRITKKETDAQAIDVDEGDYDQGDAGSGFGE
jgi:hypothetical protein